MLMRRRLVGLVSLAVPVVLFGCAAPPPPPPVLDLTIVGGADQNPSPTGAATAVQIYLFQLASTGKFQSADVFALTERGAANLGTDMLGSETVVVAPGETKTVNHEVKPGTTALGVVVLFRDIDHATWRAVGSIAPHGPSAMKLTTKGLIATLAPQ